MSPRQPDPHVRLQLVEAAARLLAEQGIGGVTARRLAAAIGASTQAVYTHFERMDDVIVEVWREGFRRFGGALDEPAVTADPVADFAAQGWSYRRFALTNPHLYRVMFGDGLLAFRAGRHEQDESADTFLSLLVRIERCRDSGRWHVDDLHTAGEVVWSTVHGHTSIELAGFFASQGRDPERSYVECLRATARGFGDDPALVDDSLRRAWRAEQMAASQN